MENVLKLIGLYAQTEVCTKEKDEQLLREIKEVERQMAYNETWFRTECDDDLVEACVFQRQELLARYRYLTKSARNIGLTAAPF